MPLKFCRFFCMSPTTERADSGNVYRGMFGLKTHCFFKEKNCFRMSEFSGKFPELEDSLASMFYFCCVSVQCSQDPPRRGGYFLQGLFFFFSGFFGGGFPPLFFFFWRARVEDPPRGFIVGVTLSPPREPIFSRACMHRPGLHLKKNLLAAPFSFFATQKKGSLSDSVV